MARGLRKKYDLGGPVKSPSGSAGSSEALRPVQSLNTAIFANGQQLNPTQVAPLPQVQSIPMQSGQGGGGYAQAPKAQQSSGDSDGAMAGSNITSSIFDDVSKVYNDMRQNTETNQSVANQTLNRNIERKNLALNEATAASNLRGAAQNQMQAGITFGQGQQDRAGAQATAAAWAKGVGAGLSKAA
jgi:hypothetical protein